MSWETVCKLEDIPVGGVHYSRIDDERVAICRTGERTIYAIEDNCSHSDGSLSGGTLDGTVIQCPRHGALFDVTSGKALRMPAVSPIETYPTRITADGTIEINLDESA